MDIWGGRRSRRVGVLVGLAVLASSPAILSASRASAAPGQLSLVSTSTAGVKANGPNAVPSVSADGTKVAFASAATNLHPADGDALGDVYVKDVVSGELRLASISETGLKADAESFGLSLSADGTRVAFDSWATNLDPADDDGLQDIYLKDLESGAVSVASTSTFGVKGNSQSIMPSLSADGTKVAFRSLATNLDPADGDTISDIYVKDLVSGDLTLVSTSDTGVKGNATSEYPSLSADGSAVAFHSWATNLEPGSAGGLHVYVKSLVSGDLTRVSVFSDSREPSLSADGTKVAFDLDPHIYLKDLVSGELTLVSTSDAGLAGNGSSGEPSVSPDGTKVAFESGATNLDPADGDGVADAYVKDLESGDLTLVSISSAGVKGNGHSEWPVLSNDGSAVAFYTEATNLDPVDGDTFADVYVKELAAPPSITIRDRSVVEGSSGRSGIAFAVSLSGPSSSPVSVQFATIDGTATSPADYTATSGTLVFAPGQTTARIKVAVVPDLVPEADESFTVQLSNPVGATLGDAVAVGRIRNDD